MNHRSPPGQPPACATFARLAPLLDTGDLDPDQERWAREHLKTCASCQRRVAGYEIVTEALRRHYGGMRSPVSLPTVEDLMRIADMETADMDAVSDAPRTPTRAPLPPRPPQAPQRRMWRPLVTALTAARVLAVIGTLFALRGQFPAKGPATGQTPQPGQRIVEVSLGGKLPAPTAIAIDKHGGVWVLSPQNNAIGYLYVADPTARPPYSQYVWVAPTANSGLAGLAIASDGSVWFTESNAKRIGRIVPKPLTVTATPGGALNEFTGGAITEFRYKSYYLDGPPSEIVAGSNGLLWFTELASAPNFVDSVRSIHMDGTFGVAAWWGPQSGALSVARAPDGALWFAKAGAAGLDRVDPTLLHSEPTKAITHYALPHPAGDHPSIAVGSDGAVWFIERGDQVLGRMSPDGKVTEIPVPTPDSGLANLAVAADGSVWFTESKANKIGNVSPRGDAIKEIRVPTASAQPNGIAIAPDGTVWFTETASGKIGYLKP